MQNNENHVRNLGRLQADYCMCTVTRTVHVINDDRINHASDLTVRHTMFQAFTDGKRQKLATDENTHTHARNITAFNYMLCVCMHYTVMLENLDQIKAILF